VATELDKVFWEIRTEGTERVKTASPVVGGGDAFSTKACDSEPVRLLRSRFSPMAESCNEQEWNWKTQNKKDPFLTLPPYLHQTPVVEDILVEATVLDARVLKHQKKTH
jgi:hypothetical protein